MTVSSGGIIFNDSLFIHVTKELVFGVEFNFFYDFLSNETYVAVYPQATIVLTSTLVLQIGLGLHHTSTNPYFPILPIRFINVVNT